MTDRVDEWALNYLHDFDGTPLQSVAKGQVDLGKLQDEAEKKAAEEAAEASAPALLACQRALVVDDYPEARDGMVGMLLSIGCKEVDQAVDGAGALARLAMAAAKGEPYDLLLLDWLLPDMTGGELIAALQGKGLALPARTIVVSAADSAVLRQEATHSGITEVVQKPLLPNVLRRICAAQLAEPVGGAADHGVAAAGSLRGMAILLVEDNELNQQVAGEILKSWGASVDVAANGQIALDLLFSHSPSYYAAVLMDLEMRRLKYMRSVLLLLLLWSVILGIVVTHHPGFSLLLSVL